MKKRNLASDILSGEYKEGSLQVIGNPIIINNIPAAIENHIKKMKAKIE